MRIRTSIGCGAALALLAPSPASAGPGQVAFAVAGIAGAALGGTVCFDDTRSEHFGRNSVYAGVLGGYALASFNQRTTQGPGRTANAEDSASISVHGGYRCHPNAALEVDFELPHPFNAADKDVSVYTVTANSKLFPLTDLVDRYTFDDRIQPFLLTGMGVLAGDSTKGNDNDGAGFVVRLGGGLDVYATDWLLVEFSTSYLRPFGDKVGTLDYLSLRLGLTYRF